MGRRSVISRADLRYLALEGLVVLFGVLIALVVDGWREEAARRARGDAALDRVVEEATLNLEIYRLISSETFYRPDRQTIAIRISERIMEQQLALVRDLIPLYRDFLQAAGGGIGGEDGKGGGGDR